MNDSAQNKTEAATPRRREDARKKGQTAQSHELTGGLSFFVSAVLLWVTSAPIAAQLQAVTHNELIGLSRQDITVATVQQMAGAASIAALNIVGPMMGCLWLSSVAVGFGQTRGLITFQPFEPDITKFSIFKGWKRIWNSRSLVRMVNVTVRVIVVSLLVYWAIYAETDAFALGRDRVFVFTSLSDVAEFGSRIGIRILIVTAIVFLVTGIIDYMLEWRKHEVELRMTLVEVKEDQKQEEGDPHLRARIKRVAREINKKSMLNAVPASQVVITNPTHFAVALSFDRNKMAAPKVVAKGTDLFAKRIITIARKHGVPIVERPPLARALFGGVDVGQEIPAAFYRVVAQVLAYVSRLRKAA